jgi:hypothetical protein
MTELLVELGDTDSGGVSENNVVNALEFVGD